MRIVRHLDSSGQPRYAALQPDGIARALPGDPLGGFGQPGAPVVPGPLLAPIVPTGIWCIGLNYRQHAAETGSKLPEVPILFAKGLNTVQNPGGPIELPRHLRSDEVDYECELAVVIGRRGKNISPERALEHVLGYTCANDISARDWQVRRSGHQWCRGKTFDTFCPLGPCLVTPEDLPDPNALRIRTRLNGQVVQDSSTADMIFNVPELIAFLSASTTLLPGTVILTGTPQGVGMARKPPLWLQPGDRVAVEIDLIGVLENPVVEEPLPG
jgi:2-keto-4-pentenoate hydratase/2-oxohepta-3-ene-1,7-dioic acid hydratase in catechol pathway